MEEQLSIAQKIYLLFINPGKGGYLLRMGNTLNYTLAGAVLLELAAENKISIEGKKITPVETRSSLPYQQRVLDKISSTGNARSAVRWIRRLSFSNSALRNEIRQSLYIKRYIRLEEKQFLVFRWKKPHLSEKAKVADLIKEIETWIFTGTSEPENLYLLSLLIPGEMLRRLFSDKEKRRAARKRLKQMGVENVVSKAVAVAISTARAAAT